MRNIFFLILTLLACLLFPGPNSQAANLAVMEFELKDLTLNPKIKEETERAATLRPLLAERLATHHKHTVVENTSDVKIESERAVGYLFERPAVAARLGRSMGVDWVVSGRLHKGSYLFVYLKAQLIDAKSGGVKADFAVEIKGPQQKLTYKGVESLAQQINDALEQLEPAGSP